MAFPFRHQFGGAVQALFRLDHVAGGEAIFAASVLAEFDQIGRAAHRAHDLVELVDPVAVPMRELRHVAAREGRLLMRDRVQPKGRIGDDPRAIAARDLAVHLGAVGLDPFALDAPILDTFGGRADLALRLQRDALRFEAAMVDARVDVEFGQALIGKLGPAFAPALDHLGAVPVPHLLAKTVLVHRAHGQHDMGMGFGHAVLGHVPMHIEIGDHAPIHELGPNEVAGQFDALRLASSRAGWRIRPRGQAGRPCGLRTPRHRSRAVRGRSTPPARSPAASPRNGRRRAWRKSRGCDQAARRAAASPSGRRLTPPRWSQTCGQ